MVDRDGKPAELGLLLYQVTTALRPRVTAQLKLLGIGMPEYACLHQLSAAPAQSLGELARRTGVSPQAMNNVVRELQELGALSRPTDVAAGRNLPMRLTPKGRGLLRRAESAVRAVSDQILAPLSPAERNDLIRLLQAVDLKAI